jgi:hypothetical protein
MNNARTVIGGNVVGVPNFVCVFAAISKQPLKLDTFS